MTDRAAELLGPDGPLARQLEGYEARSGQLEMARAVTRALTDDRVLLCEAGTGTGKTLAYLVPAILSGKKVVVSTATRALQEQIVGHDLRIIREELGLRCDVAVMKGLSNYLCRRRYEEALSSDAASRPKYARSFGAIETWVEETETGDIAELAGLAENDAVVAQVVSSSETRIGQGCRHFDQCFVTRMKREAEAARLLIVNHHLFFADLALRGPHPGHVIPDYDAVVFDEAHKLEDIATSFFGVRVSSARIETTLRDADRAVVMSGLGDPLFSPTRGRDVVDRARRAADELWAEVRRTVRSSDGRAIMEKDMWQGPLEKAWHAIDETLDALFALTDSSHEALRERERARGIRRAPSVADMVEQVARRTRQLRQDIEAIVDGSPGRVTWLDTTQRGIALSSSPIDLSMMLKDRVFESIPAVVLTSATLTSARRSRRLGEETDREVATEPPAETEGDPGVDFHFLRSRIGLAGDEIQVDELIVPSPFDFERRALLYTPRDLPSPRDGRFLPAAISRIRELVDVTDGGAFVLTTSVRSMRALHRALVDAGDARPVLVQGDAPKSTLLGRFRASGNSVLVATMSFWEGVDVPGGALRLVVLEKIPFAVPTDPIARARSGVIEGRGGNPFMDYHVPTAAISLKQGFGRLIRSHRDAGIVALLDERIHRRGYGTRLLAALPGARRVETMDRVRAFWRSCAAL